MQKKKIGEIKIMVKNECNSCWNYTLSKEDIQERKLYKNIVEILLKNKDKIEYIESKLINNTTYHYFKYKGKEIDICQYDWKESVDKYNLTVDDIWFSGSNSFSFKYLDLCKYLWKLGEDKEFDERLKKSKEESIKISNKTINKLENTLKSLKED